LTMQTELSATQKTQTRSLLSFTAAKWAFFFLFDFDGVTLKVGFEGAESSPRETLAFLTNQTLPSDPDALADYLYSLADALEKAGQIAAVPGTYTRAVSLLTASAEKAKTPEEKARLLARAAQTSAYATPSKASDILKNATVKYPNCWQTWANLGSHYCAYSFAETLPKKAQGAAGPDVQKAVEYLEKNPPSKNQLARRDKWVQDGMRAFDKAIALAPRNADLLIQRALARWCVHLLTNVRTPGSSNLESSPLPASVQKDIDAAVAIDGANFRVASVAAAAAVAQTFQEGGTPDVPAVERASSRLQAIAGLPSTQMAATILMEMDKLDAALAIIRRAQTGQSEEAHRADNRLDQLAVMVLLRQEKLEEARDRVIQLLKREDNITLSRVLAKIHLGLGQMGESVKLLQATLAKDPQDPLTLLALANVLLQESATRPAALDEAGKYLKRVADLPQGTLDPTDMLYYRIASAVNYLLQGNKSRASLFIDMMAISNPDNETVKQLKELAK
jgi:tetratricopeptide (TPR) repeat protein